MLDIVLYTFKILLNVKLIVVRAVLTCLRTQVMGTFVYKLHFLGFLFKFNEVYIRKLLLFICPRVYLLKILFKFYQIVQVWNLLSFYVVSFLLTVSCKLRTPFRVQTITSVRTFCR